MSALQCMPQPGSRRQCWCNAQCRLPGLRSQARFPFTPARAQPHCCRTIGANAALRNLQCAQQPATGSISVVSGSRLAIPSVSTLLTVLAAPLPSIADEAKADDAALEAAQQYSTVTFGGSFGQWDPVIAVFFYLVVGSLTVLTLGVSLKPESCAAVLRDAHAQEGLLCRYCTYQYGTGKTAQTRRRTGRAFPNPLRTGIMFRTADKLQALLLYC